MKRSLGFFVLCSAIVLGAPAAAGVSSLRDANDGHGPLDIRKIVHGHTDDGKLFHKVVMWNRWGARDLEGQDEIRFEFSTDREDRYDEVNASVSLRNGELGAWIFPYTEGGDYTGVGPSTKIRFSRPDRFTVTIFFGKKWVDNRRDRYAWSVRTNYKDPESKNCTRYCYDKTERLGHNL